MCRVVLLFQESACAAHTAIHIYISYRRSVAGSAPHLYWNLVRKFFQHVIPAIIRPLRILWNELIGLVFLVFAVAAVPQAIRGIRDYNGDAGSLIRLVITIVFGLVMAVFGIQSFLRARRISRS
jgi:hypothetical protein